MISNDIGALVEADEGLNHQIVDTFATVAQADLGWTEKIWGSIACADGSLQINFGLGKYGNRGVVDGFGGISRGREQITVRGSRELHSAPEAMSVGPIHYEILDPLKTVRFRLEPNDVQPVSFDLVLSGVTPPFFEDRNLTRNPQSGRRAVDVIRYHQCGWASGTVTVEGETREVRPEEWFGVRDHSWGVRQAVGVQPPDVVPSITKPPPEYRGHFKWTPMFLRRPDGSYYETAMHIANRIGATSAYMNEGDGSQQRVRSVEPDVQYDPRTRFVRGGRLHIEMESGDQREIEFEAVGECGFFLKPTGYGMWKGHKHGVWHGPLVLGGEHLADCWDDEHLPILGQLRDTPIRAREGDAEGFGIMESMIFGEWPELGLTAESDHRADYL